MYRDVRVSSHIRSAEMFSAIAGNSKWDLIFYSEVLSISGYELLILESQHEKLRCGLGALACRYTENLRLRHCRGVTQYSQVRPGGAG